MQEVGMVFSFMIVVWGIPSSCREMEKPFFCHPQFFLCMNHSRSRLWVCIFLPLSWLCVYVPLSRLNVEFSSFILGCVSSRCFSVEDWGGFLPHDFFTVVSPTFWDVVGYGWVVLAMIGPRMTQGSTFFVQAINHLFCCMYAVVSL